MSKVYYSPALDLIAEVGNDGAYIPFGGYGFMSWDNFVNHWMFIYIGEL